MADLTIQPSYRVKIVLFPKANIIAFTLPMPHPCLRHTNNKTFLTIKLNICKDYYVKTT
jgi:hypothetical protein